MRSLWGLDPAAYRPHRLHAPDRDFAETNCYVDVWIELLHARGAEPVAMLAFCAAIDWEGDQWTFFKPPHADLEALYGVEVEELAIYRPLLDHLLELLARGRTSIVEVDGFHLPDVAGRSYGITHEKTSIAPEAIDAGARRLRYFHNAGYYELAGDDFDEVLRTGARELSPDVLPPYAELVRADRLVVLPADELREAAARLLARHVGRLPAANPVEAFAARLAEDLPSLLGDAQAYHHYAFATLRQCGAAWSLLAEFLRWLGGEAAAAAPIADGLAGASRRLTLKLARVGMGRAVDPAPALADLAAGWDDLAAALRAATGVPAAR